MIQLTRFQRQDARMLVVLILGLVMIVSLAYATWGRLPPAATVLIGSIIVAALGFAGMAVNSLLNPQRWDERTPLFNVSMCVLLAGCVSIAITVIVSVR